jgi:hypothetical protein
MGTRVLLDIEPLPFRPSYNTEERFPRPRSCRTAGAQQQTIASILENAGSRHLAGCPGPIEDGMDDRLSRLEHRWLHNARAKKSFGLLWHLALRRVPMAMTELSRQLGSGGSLADAYPPRALLAAHIGEATGWELTISHWITSIAQTCEVIGTGRAALATLTQTSNFVGLNSPAAWGGA